MQQFATPSQAVGILAIFTRKEGGETGAILKITFFVISKFLYF